MKKYLFLPILLLVLTWAGFTTSTHAQTCATSPIVVSPAGAALPSAQTGVAYNQTLTATGGVGTSYTYALTSGAFPSGITMSSAGVISGSTSLGGFVTVGITATSSAGCVSAVRSYTFNICSVAITVTPTTPLFSWAVGGLITPVTHTAAPAGTYTFTATGLPNGIDLSTAGVLSGTPTTPGTGSYRVMAANASACNGVRVYNYNVTCPTAISTAPADLSFINIRQNALMTPVTIVPTGGTAPYTFTLIPSPTTPSSLPTGITLGLNTGILSGTPSNLGLAAPFIRIVDAVGCIRTITYNFQVFRPCTGNIQIQPSTALPAVVVNTLITPITVTSTGGVSIFPLQPNNVTYEYTITAGALPTGLNINANPATASNWLISGTPTVSGTFTFTVTSTDGTGCTGTRSYTLIVRATPCPAITISPTARPFAFIENTAITDVNMSAAGGLAPYTYDVIGGSFGGNLPAGLTFTNGVISGTPTTASPSGVGNIIVRAIDVNGCIGTVTYSFIINPSSCSAITINPAGSALVLTVNTAMPNINLSASGGVAPYTYSVGANTLPGSVNLFNTTIIGGTPSTAGNGAFTVRVVDANGCIGLTTYTFIVNPATCPTITVNPTGSALTYTVGTNITDIMLSATPVNQFSNFYSYTISAGLLPAGLTVGTSPSRITGTPQTAGTGTFTVRATDANNCTGTTTYTFTVNPVGTPVPPVVPPVVPPNPTTAIDNTLADMVKVSPNPSKDVFNIDFGKVNTGKSSIRVYDLQGKTVYSSEMNTNIGVISLEKATAGMYLLEITTTKGRIIKKIVKQ